ncbi:flagellar hook-length control protein FliK [Paraburkholderia diazotrophica]|uniref:Hook-length control protein FliK n=1 Tax=Paraburkholderia diazotrophica TaxID=667676 RepID=A0A1H7DFC3_9BURK|nr:flagellar hook-length control protein FliK [Paraburkholderia diazotrophica]SEK00499.1 hook-length control protein FliK [Paraburkholderia diazotrophica]
MNGIDSAVATLLASRIDSLLSVGARASATASQADASLNVRTPATPVAATPAPLPASAQTALSAVALTLDAITRSGGEATPALVGQAPVWPAAPAIDVAPLPLFDAGTGASGASAVANAAGNAASMQGAKGEGANAAQGSNAASNVVAAPVPVAELAAALMRTVDESGLFYESHLAQWLSGQRPVESLAAEPQNHLADMASQLPLDWSHDADDPLSWTQGHPASGAGSGAAASANFAARGAPDGPHAQSARFTTFDMATHDIIDMTDEHAAPHAASASAAGIDDSNGRQPQSMAAALHPATIPLVRQQLDLLATGQFRWTGEAWPGARLDWTIEQEGDEWRRGGSGASSADDEYPWRTRLTLSLPTLGTVDAELTLTGTRLVARVLASPGGAARLSAQGDAFRQRLAQAGIELSGLSIREIGGNALAGGAAAAAAAASAYARSTDTRSTDAPAGKPHSHDAADDNFDWELQ